MRATPAKKGAIKPSSGTRASKVFTAEERDAIRQRAKEVKAAARNEDGESAVVARIASMPAPDRALAERLHALIKTSAPNLSPRLWYGMPAYAKGGKIICHFQDAKKFKTRYATIGFSDAAQLDEGAMWPVAFALNKLTSAEEAKIRALLEKALR